VCFDGSIISTKSLLWSGIPDSSSRRTGSQQVSISGSVMLPEARASLMMPGAASAPFLALAVAV